MYVTLQSFTIASGEFILQSIVLLLLFVFVNNITATKTNIIELVRNIYLVSNWLT